MELRLDQPPNNSQRTQLDRLLGSGNYDILRETDWDYADNQYWTYRMYIWYYIPESHLTLVRIILADRLT